MTTPPPARSAHRGEWAASITVLVDPSDDAMVTRALRAAHCPAGGVVTVHPTPATRSEAALAADLFVALGQSPTRLAAYRLDSAVLAWRAITAWMAAERIAHLVVLRAHRLTAGQRQRLLTLHHATGVHLVLVWHAHPVDARDIVGYPVRITRDHAALVAACASPGTTARPSPDTMILPVPIVFDADAGDFRAAARREHSSEDFARIDAVYISGMRAGCRWAADCSLDERAHAEPADAFSGTNLSSQAAAGIDQVALLRFLGALAADSPSRGHTVARLRGAQRGLHMHGIRVELPPNLAFSVGPGLTTVPVTEQTADRIRSVIPSPTHAAALAALLCTGSPAPHLASIPVSALTSDAGALVLSGAVGRRHYRHPTAHPIPAAARPLLAAARTYVQLRDTDANQLLLSGGIGTTGQHLRTSVRMCEVNPPALHPWSDGWLTRVEVQAMSRPRQVRHFAATPSADRRQVTATGRLTRRL
ncbi:hypothetical protein FND50_34165 [Rhodococcus sp. WB9]|uniref:hypothetical protein n=1 Tax=Rhodococcus sp. WB9 TaxID=2594007 RepID=UPI001185524E|nr:hypothetical protein [Rhodococcus sp. WB9]QDQ95297.1 hypothetical protein FND50_34165 [Rhodococcus sp. WB9]